MHCTKEFALYKRILIKACTYLVPCELNISATGNKMASKGGKPGGAAPGTYHVDKYVLLTGY